MKTDTKIIQTGKRTQKNPKQNKNPAHCMKSLGASGDCFGPANYALARQGDEPSA